ncbi:nuclear transport factor 2 family protein [Roseibium aggregatum]|uniref:nuclear transport factor 2 family protein n=1 Tax=Roseibium aggregatum TaxID=187304 RepID=UPI001E4479FF|nr:nuclear transport factor 2 family protein [Roseibium aggregatum]
MNMYSQPQAADHLVQKLFDCIDRKDWDGLAQHLHDDVTYERPGYEALVGKDAVLDFYNERRIIAAGVHSVEQVVAAHPHIACWGSFSGRSKEGDALKVRFADVYQLQNGQVWYRKTFFDSPAV